MNQKTQTLIKKVKTADTGYMSRRLSKGLEDLFLQYDCTVRNTGGGIIQFCYGDDGMDPVGMEGKNGKPLNFERLYLRSKAICPNNGDDAVLSSSDACKLFHKKLLEVGLEDDIMSEAGSSAEFLNSLQSFVKDSTKLKEAFTEDDFNDLKNFIRSTSGTTHRQLEVFLDLCLSRYRSKKIEAGTPIGIIGAHSIGEPGTQMTLKTFHFAGVASMNITLGVPRIGEIIDGSKKIRTPIITAVLQRNDNIKTARMVKGRIEKTKLGQVAKTIKLVKTSRSASILISLDMKSIQDLQIDANTVKESILRTKKLKLKSEDIKILDIKKLEVVPQVTDRSIIHFQLNFLKSLLPSVVVKGIETAERVVIKNDQNKFELLVEGTGLQHVMGVEDVDGLKTYSNHVIEVGEVLGIEAARTRIIEEIKFTMGSHGMNIDTRHIMLLADVMTNRGQILGMTRHGIAKLDKSVLMLASFEMTADHLFNAAIHGRNDPIKGVSECIIMGIPTQMGTGMIKVKQRLNHPKLPQGTSPLLSED